MGVVLKCANDFQTNVCQRHFGVCIFCKKLVTVSLANSGVVFYQR